MSEEQTMTMTATPTPIGRTYQNPLKVPSKSAFYVERDPTVMLWADIQPLVAFPGDRVRLLTDRNGDPWRMVDDEAVSLHRIREYKDHGFSIVDKAYDKTPRQTPNGVIPKSAVLEPTSIEKVQDHIYGLCMADAEQRLDTPGA